MDNIRFSLETIFKKINPETIISKYICQDINNKKIIENDIFTSIFSSLNPDYYTLNETDNVFKLKNSKWEKSKIVSDSFFNILISFTRNVLIAKDGEIFCRYEKLLKWRDISYKLGENLFTTSFLAYNDIGLNKERNDFSWKPIISTNNVRLKEILNKGLAENHFHLKGSSPHFQLSWISLMNNILNRNEGFKKLKKNAKLYPEMIFEYEMQKEDIYLLVKKAAFIRVYFYILLKEIEINDKEFNLFKLKKRKIILSSKNNNEFDIFGNEINSSISLLRYLNGKDIIGNKVDYFIKKSFKLHNLKESINDINWNIMLSGERYFMYTVFKKIFLEDSMIYSNKELFYAYLLIKDRLRNEIIQINNKSGFGNFAEYQNRKKYFIKNGTIFEKAMYNIALNSSIVDENIVSLETRIAPEDKKKDIIETVNKIDLLTDKDNNDYFSKVRRNIHCRNYEYLYEKNFFYNIHFIKEFETEYDKKHFEIKGLSQCRNYKLRERIEKQAKAIVELKKSANRAGERIIAIDAANYEIGCRPEVFGQAFRFLRKFNIESDLNDKLGIENKSLGITYHAGEDYFDLIDGLRAIDEAIIFLNLDHGDRIGHALALGIKPKNYYKSKKYSLVLSKHDLLDNIVWMLSKIRRYNISNATLTYKLEKLYYNLFNKIYESINEKETYSCGTFFDSWKLRGDNPYFYKGDEIKFKKRNFYSFWDKCGYNYKISDMDRIRKNRKVVELIKNYHFNPDVKKSGSEIKEFKIEKEYIEAVKIIQKRMQFEIASKLYFNIFCIVAFSLYKFIFLSFENIN